MPILGSLIKAGIEIRDKIAFDRLTPIQHQQRELKKLMRMAQFTMFGQHHHFTDMLDKKNFLKQFRLAVPVHDYQSIFSKWWNKCLHEEENVCWPGRVKYFALSSGTSDSSSKHIPVTNDILKSIRKASVRQLYSLAKYDLPESFFQRGILALGGSTHLNQKGSYFEGDLSGITIKNMPFYFHHWYKPGRKISKSLDWNSKLDEITVNAKNWDIGILIGVPAWTQLLIERIIAYYNIKSIHELWPNLQLYIHGGVSFDPYRKSFEAFLNKPIHYLETYLASEGFIAFQDDPSSKGMKLLINNGLFFEFIPFNHENFNSAGELISKPQTLLINEVKENEEYALILSSRAGAWRYLIGDTIKFIDVEKCQIIITGRTKHFLSLCGEHLSLDNMNKAIEMVSDELNLAIPEFTVAGVPHNTLFAHKWYIGTDVSADPAVLRKMIDEKLKILNDDYRVERSSALKDIIVETVPASFFYSWMDKNGKTGAQNKFPRVMKKAQFELWEAFVKNEKLSIAS
jgi:hypothetical protein